MKKAQVANFQRIPGNVFVQVTDPNQVAPVPSVERYHSDWSEIATGMVADLQPQPEPVPIASADEIRIYATHPQTGKRRHVFTGVSTTPDMDVYCQDYADRTGETVELHDAIDVRVFRPVEPPELDIPIGDAKPTGVSVFNADTGLIIYEGEVADDLDSRCQRYADDNDVTLRVDSVDDDGRQRSHFYVPSAEVLRIARENAQQWAECVGDAVGVLAIVSVSWLTLIVCGGVV